jgi:hypothetical protein
MPIAHARRSGGYASTRIESESGARSAAPTPWSARNTISISSLVDRAHPTEKIVKSTKPARKTRRRP